MAFIKNRAEDNLNHYLVTIQSLSVEKAIRKQNDLFLRKKIASIEAELKETRNINKTLGYCRCYPTSLDKKMTSDCEDIGLSSPNSSSAEQDTNSSSYILRKTRCTFSAVECQSLISECKTSSVKIPSDQVVPLQQPAVPKSSYSRRHGRLSIKKIESLETEEKLLDFDKKMKRRKTYKALFVRNNKEKGTVSHFPGGYHIIWQGGLSGSDTLHDSNGFTYSCYVDHRVKLAAYQKPSDSGAVWRCTNSAPINGQKCNFMLYEKDGTFTEKSIACHKHGKIIDRSKLKCQICRTRVE